MRPVALKCYVSGDVRLFVADQRRLRRAIPSMFFRILRPDENPEGILAKDISQERIIMSYGGRKNYKSQLSSTTATLERARFMRELGGRKRPTLRTRRICKFDTDDNPNPPNAIRSPGGSFKSEELVIS